MNKILQAISNHLTNHNITHDIWYGKWIGIWTHNPNHAADYTTKIQLNPDNTIQISNSNTHTDPNTTTLHAADPNLLPRILQILQ
jgi:hypothetical protein